MRRIDQLLNAKEFPRWPESPTRPHMRGFVDRKPVWLTRPLGLKTVQNTAESMEVETRRFYEAVARRTTDTGIRGRADSYAA